MKRTIMVRVGIVILLAFTLILSLPGQVRAAEFPGDGVVPAGTTINDDVFLSADKVEMLGTVNGMLFAGGEEVNINGVVNGDVIAFGSNVIVGEGAKITGNLFAGAGNVEVRGEVTGSVLGGAGSLVLGETAKVGRNVYYGGFSFEQKTGSVVGVDLMVGGYQAILSGEVTRDLRFGGAALELNGNVGRNASIEVASPANGQVNPMMFYNQPGMPKAIDPGLRISKDARVGGKLVYTSEVEQASAIQSQPAGGIVYQTPVPEEQPQTQPSIEVRYPVLGWFFKLVRNLVTLLILGALVLWLLPSLFQRVVDAAKAKPLPAAGWGLVGVIVGYVGAFIAGVVILLVGILIAAVSLGGLSRAFFGVGYSGLGLLVAVFTLLVSYGSKLVVAFLAGHLFVEKLMPEAKSPKVWALVIGVVFYAILRSIPILGWLIGAVVTVIGLGAMWLALVKPKASVPAPITQ
jgi:cytoskeletal protein CcmA (bactofilin family)